MKLDYKLLTILFLGIVLYFLMNRTRSFFGPPAGSYTMISPHFPAVVTTPTGNAMIMNYQMYINSANLFISNVVTANLSNALPTDNGLVRTMKINVNNSANKLTNELSTFVLDHNALINVLNGLTPPDRNTYMTMQVSLLTSLANLQLYVNQLNTYGSYTENAGQYTAIFSSFNRLNNYCKQFIQFMKNNPDPFKTPSPIPQPPPPPQIALGPPGVGLPGATGTGALGPPGVGLPGATGTGVLGPPGVGLPGATGTGAPAGGMGGVSPYVPTPLSRLSGITL
jgi:hypothetical protein